MFPQTGYRSNNSALIMVTSCRWNRILAAGQCCFSEYDSTVSCSAHIESRTNCTLYFHWRRHHSNAIVFLHRTVNLCHVQRLRSIDNKISFGSRPITSTICDGYTRRHSRTDRFICCWSFFSSSIISFNMFKFNVCCYINFFLTD